MSPDKSQQPPAPMRDLAWMYPVISLAVLIGIISFDAGFWHLPYYAGSYNGSGAAAIGFIGGAICIGAFSRCPLRHWFAKILTLLFLVAALFYGVTTIGLFFIHMFG